MVATIDSSSEFGAGGAWFQYAVGGVQADDIEDDTLGVRAVRGF